MNFKSLLKLQNIMNEYYEESITTEDYINCNKTYEIEANPGLEEIIAVVLNKEEEKGENIIHVNINDPLKTFLLI
ncbi:5799_t:CDS:2 [Entrophospora sp. SA101]|nr:5799_t:CDS:2 [Entrophospora sp. SA101]